MKYSNAENKSFWQSTKDDCDLYTLLSRGIESTRENQKVIKNNEKEEFNKPETNRHSEKRVSENSSFETASLYKGKKTCVVNLTFGNVQGGGAAEGKTEQEASLCRVSTLYKCLAYKDIWKNYYLPIKELEEPENAMITAVKNVAEVIAKKDKGLEEIGKADITAEEKEKAHKKLLEEYKKLLEEAEKAAEEKEKVYRELLKGAPILVYSPDIYVFKSEENPDALLPDEEWFKSDVITVSLPAPLYSVKDTENTKETIATDNAEKSPEITENKEKTTKASKKKNIPQLTIESEKSIYDRFIEVFRAAYTNGAEVLIIPAPDKKFKIEPVDLAKILKEVIDECEGWFETIEFALSPDFTSKKIVESIKKNVLNA